MLPLTILYIAAGRELTWLKQLRLFARKRRQALHGCADSRLTQGQKVVEGTLRVRHVRVLVQASLHAHVLGDAVERCDYS